MNEHDLVATSLRTDDGVRTLAQRALRVGWWVTAATLTVGVYVALDRAAWVDALAETTQGGLRIASGAALIALAGLLDPWGSDEDQRD